MEKFFNAEKIIVKGWEGLTTQQIGRAIERYITEREERGFKVCKVICGNAIINLPQGGGKVTEAYLWPKLLDRFEKKPHDNNLITIEQ